MKKVTGMLLALLLIVGLAVPAMAASTEYEIPEFGITLSIPDGYDVFTRNMKADDPLLKEYGLTRSDLMEILGTNTYLDAMGSQGDDEIVVTANETGYSDMDGMTDATLNFLASGLEEEYSSYGFDVMSTEIYREYPHVFVNIDFYIPEDDVYTMQYFTVYNGAMLCITLRSYTGIPSTNQVKNIRSVADSLTIPSDTQPQAEKIPAFLYTDEKTGTTFTVPAGWTELGVTEENGLQYIQFSFSRNPTQILQYCSIDMYEDMGFFDRLSRNNQKYEDAFLEGFLGGTRTPKPDIKKMQYNGVTYSVVEVPVTSDLLGVPITVTVSQAVYTKDGWIYAFQFFGGLDNPFFGELEKVLESVEYGDTDTHSGNAQVIAITLVALMVALILLAIVISTRKQKKEAGDMDISQYVYCPSCGKRMPDDSRFCDGCGARLTKKEREQ